MSWDDDLDIHPIREPDYGAGRLSPNDRAELFHQTNPHVYENIVRITKTLQNRYKFRRGAIAMIFERMRWLYAIRTHGDNYKLNNDYRAWYARKVMAEHVDLEGFFEIRIQRSIGVV
jgi:hypothetical protein